MTAQRLDGKAAAAGIKAELRERVAALRERAGRHVPVTFYGAKPETLDELRDAGVDRALIVLKTEPEPSIPSLT